MAEDNNILPIKLNIQGIGKPAYSFAVQRGDELAEILHRQAEKLVNEWMAYWSSNIKGDAMDCLAMTALTIAINSIRERMAGEMDAELSELEALERQVGDYLNRIK